MDNLNNIVSQPKLLLFDVNIFKADNIKKVCESLGISVICVDRCDYAQKLGAIAGIVGFGMVNMIYLGRGLSDEMMVFSGIDSELLDKFLSEYKKNGIEPINYKAVLTVNNIFWTPEELFAELKKEHRKFSGR